MFFFLSLLICVIVYVCFYCFCYHLCGEIKYIYITHHHSRSRHYEKNLPMSWELLKGIEIKVLHKPLKIASLLYVCILYLLGIVQYHSICCCHFYVIVSHTTRDLY